MRANNKSHSANTYSSAAGILLGMLLLNSPSNAGVRHWVGLDGIWTDTANWSLSAGGSSGASVPGTGDQVIINPGDSISRTITYQQPLAVTLTDFSVDHSGSGVIVFDQSQDVLTAGSSTIARTGTVTYNLNGGLLDIGSLTFAQNSGSVGTLNMSSGASLVSNDFFLGRSGTGTLNQAGGSVNAGSLFLGTSTNGSGHYTLDAGTLNTASTSLGGATGGTGDFLQNGGTHTITGDLTVTAGMYRMNAGTLTADSILMPNSGTFDLAGGNVSVNVFDGGNSILTLDGTTGVFNANVINGGTFNVTSGAFDSNVINGGTFNISNGQALSLVAINGGSFALTGASALNVSSDIILGSGASLDVSGGSGLTASNVTLNNGGSLTLTGLIFDFSTLVQNGGALTADITVDATDSFTFNGGSFNGALTNDGQTTLNAGFISPVNMVNNATLDVAGGVNITADGTGLDNNATMNLSGGTIAGSGPFVNDGTLTSAGSLAINNSAGFSNNSQLTMTGGALTLGGGPIVNRGNIELAFLGDMTVNSALSSGGDINLKGGNITGTGVLTNLATGVLSGSGAISNDVDNAGTVNAMSGNLTIGGASFVNSGLIKNSVGSNLFIAAPGLTHTGSIEVSAAGSVATAAAITNNSGQTITMNGGALGTGGLTNAAGGNITGFGSLSGNLTNNGSVDFFGTTSLVGNLDNQSTGHFLVRNDQTLITGHTTNDGTIETLNGQVIFEGGLTNNGALLFDPATITVSTLDVGTNGYLAETGGPGDRFIITEDFNNASIENGLWSTANTIFQFNGGVHDVNNPQILEVAGVDIGALGAGWIDNFALGTLEIGTSATYVQLADSFDNSDICLGEFCEIWSKEALYVVDLILEAGTVLDLAGFSLYVSNSFINDGGMVLNGSVIVASAVPLPAPVWLLASGLAGLGILGRRRKRPLRTTARAPLSQY